MSAKRVRVCVRVTQLDPPIVRLEIVFAAFFFITYWVNLIRARLNPLVRAENRAAALHSTCAANAVSLLHCERRPPARNPLTRRLYPPLPSPGRRPPSGRARW